MKKLFVLLAVSFSILFPIACNKGDNEQQPDGFDRKALLVNTADNIIIPAYTNFQAVYNEMKAAAIAFTNAPDAAKLTSLRQKWRAAYLGWQQVELFNFGPAETVLLRNYFNIYPTDVNLLRTYISSGSYNLEQLTNNKVQGFPALDYLLNGSGANDVDVVANYSTGADANKWKKYLSDVVASMDTKLGKVVNDWIGSYRQQFINNDGTGAGSSLSLMMNEYIMNFERFLRSGKFAIPAGIMSGTPTPDKVEAFYSKDFGIELARTALKASQDLYLGKAFGGGSTGPSLYSYLQALGKNSPNLATLAANIESQFAAIDAKMIGLGNSIYTAIINNRSSVLSLYDEFQKKVRNLKVDMASAIGITISYTDNDGD